MNNDPDAIIRQAILTNTAKLQARLKAMATEHGPLSRTGREADMLLNASMEGYLLRRLGSLNAMQHVILFLASGSVLGMSENRMEALWQQHMQEKRMRRMT